MILKKVSLENFISHRDNELKFDYGINVITGPNGAGKTSILDAVSFGLFNIHSRGKKENLISRRYGKSRVFVEFSEGGLDYGVEWGIDRKKPASGVLFRLQDGERSIIARGGERVITSEVERIIGFDKNLFLQSIYVRQGEIESLVTATPAVRKGIISKLLGLEDLEKAYQSMRDVVNEYQNIKSILSGELERKPKVEEQIQSLRREIERLKVSLESEKSKLNKIDEELRILEMELQELDRKKERFNELNSQKVVLETEIKSLREQLSQKEAALKEAEAAFKKVESLKEDVAKLPIVEDYVILLHEKDGKEKDRAQEQERLKRIDSLGETLTQNVESYNAYNEKNALLAQKRAERRNYEGAREELRRVKRQLLHDLKRRNKRDQDLAQGLEKYSKILGEEVTAENLESILLVKKNELESSKVELDEKVDGLREKIGNLKGRMDEIEFKLAKISEAEVCPICGRELTPEHRARLQEEFEEARQQNEREIGILNEELEKVDAEKEKCEEKLRQVASVDPGKIKEIIVEIEELDEKNAQQRSDVEELEKKAEALGKIDEEIERLEGEIDELKEAYQEYEAAKRELDKCPPRGDVETSLNKISAELQTISEKMGTLLEKLGYRPKDPEQELVELRGKKEEYDKNEQLARKKDKLQSDVGGLKQELATKRLNLETVVGEVQDLGYDEGAHKEKIRGFEGLRQERVGVENLKVEIETKVGEKESLKSGLESELKQLLEKEQEKKRVEAFVKILEKIRGAFHKDGLQRLIRARSRPLMERMTRDFFERFNLEYSDVQIDDDYNISVIGPAGAQTVDQISGGERVALAIALRLAIARVLSEKVETVILDEPTTHLDEERRRELVNILNSFFREGGRIIPQMIVITHHREIEDVADVIYNVSKKEGFSTVEMGLT